MKGKTLKLGQQTEGAFLLFLNSKIVRFGYQFHSKFIDSNLQ